MTTSIPAAPDFVPKRSFDRVLGFQDGLLIPLGVVTSPRRRIRRRR